MSIATFAPIAGQESVFSVEQFCDDLGPSQVVHLYDPTCGMRAVVVVDNTACGTAIGGVRMAADVTTEEVFRLARAMTLKNAAAGLAHGGGKAGILANPKQARKQSLMRAFARAIRTITDYVPGPDMGTDESCMAWIRDEIGRAVGLPTVLGGIPLDQIGATGFGVAAAAKVAAPFCNLNLDGARLAVEGFGNVGRHAAAHLAQLGARLVAASDSRGSIFNAHGIDVDRLTDIKLGGGSVLDYDAAERHDKEDLFGAPCDILVPAARPDCIHAENAPYVQARLILQGANIPCTEAAEKLLHKRGVLVVPDFIANAGGVICASVEYRRGTKIQAFEQIAERIERNTLEVIQRSREEHRRPREAALDLARQRVQTAMRFRSER